MRAEYLIAASLIGASVAIPAAFVVAMSDAVPGISAGQAAGARDDQPLTLVTRPMLAPADANEGAAYRTVVAEIDLPGRNSADRLCRDNPRLSDDVLLYLHDRGASALDALNGHDATLTWVLAHNLDAQAIEGAAIVEADRIGARAGDRPLYECRGAVAWKRPDPL
ncbi:MAG: hypothetical protein RIB45_05215 [Marivibrio sp.]|uniref:hypothetical protein n=1 Tax=Marivibrio sp. TaxID=2039719 RepID=UPI0032EB977B